MEGSQFHLNFENSPQNVKIEVAPEKESSFEDKYGVS